MLSSVLFLPLSATAQGFEMFKGFRISGTGGISAETYASGGIPARRPPFSGQAFLNINFDLFGLTTGVNTVLSTEESQFRQDINRVQLNTQIQWAKISGGDVTPSFNKYGLDGISVRGGMIEANPQSMIISAVVGQGQSATASTVEDAFRGQSYGQWFYGTKLGYGDESANYFHLTGFWGRDYDAAINDFDFSFDFEEPDPEEPPAEEETLPPVPIENYIIGPQGAIELFGGKIRLEGGMTASIYSRNTEIDRTTHRNAALFGLIALRPQTQLSYAGDGEIQWVFGPFRMLTGYERIEPGYESMGLVQIQDDQQVFRLTPQMKFFKNKMTVKLNYNRRNNNLDLTRTSTTVRQQSGITLSAQPITGVNINTGYDRVGNVGRNQADASLESNQLSQSITFSPSWTKQKNETSHNLMLITSFQFMDDERPAFSAHTENKNATLSYALTLPKRKTLSVSANILKSDTPTMQTSASGAQLNFGMPLYKQKIQANLIPQFSGNQSVLLIPGQEERTVSGQNLSISLNLGYKLKSGDVVQFVFKGLKSNQDNNGTIQSFREFQGNMTLNRNF